MALYETLSVEQARPGVMLVTLDRPARLNALTFQMFRELRSLADVVAADDTVRVLVLPGPAGVSAQVSTWTRRPCCPGCRRPTCWPGRRHGPTPSPRSTG